MKYTYYVVYLFGTEDKNWGSGYSKIERERPIDTFEEVLSVVKSIENNSKIEGVSIINWKRLD